MIATSPVSWQTATRARVRDLQDALLAMATWARDSGADQPTVQALLEPYRDLLDAVYERDMPLAKLADESDLLLHVHGPAASGPAPRVAVLTRLLSSTRDQVTRLAKQLGGVTSARVPYGLDMGLVGVAGGSLFIGFSATDATGVGDITRTAVEMIAKTSLLVFENATIDKFAEAITDPGVRDMAIAAVRHLSPSGHIGIKEIDILGRAVEVPSSLTTDTRRHARGIMAQRTLIKNDPVTFVGTVGRSTWMPLVSRFET
jgi:hypothetical protein